MLSIGFRLSVITAFLFLLTSCTGKKKLVYFQGELKEGSNTVSQNPVLRKNDVLSISVVGVDADAAKPFNLPVTSSSQNQGGYTQGNQPPPGYLIDEDGTIHFPVIGKIKMAGLTRSMAIDTLTRLLNPYFQNSAIAHTPTILLRILNFKVTVLGDVRNPGTFTIPNEHISLPEALGLAGDLNITGLRKNILVVRETDGKKTEVRVDLTSSAAFNSPAYYLQQNDVVYVEPNRSRINSAIVNPANAGIIISAISLIVTILVLVTR